MERYKLTMPTALLKLATVVELFGDPRLKSAATWRAITKIQVLSSSESSPLPTRDRADSAES